MNFELLNKDHFDDIVDLEQFLWSGDIEYRKKMLKWKYFETPFEDKLTGAVAKYNNKVVGFRGLVPSNWSINNKKIKTFFFTDAVVHPDYRGHNLLAKLNNFLIQQYQNKFQFVLALSSNNLTTKIHKAQGSGILTYHIFYKKFIITSVFKSDNYKTIPASNINAIWDIFQQFDAEKNDCFNFYLTKEYLHWKLSEPNKNFILVYDRTTKPECYAIIERRKRNIEVYDFGYKNNLSSVLKLLKNYCKAQRIFYINLPLFKKQENQLLSILRKHRYSTYKIVKKIKPDYTIQREILIKPFKETFTEEDWTVEGLNAYDYKNWEFKHLLYV